MRIPTGPIPLRRDQAFGMNSSGLILPSEKRPKNDFLRAAAFAYAVS
jgi:hypothetical protein